MSIAALNCYLDALAIIKNEQFEYPPISEWEYLFDIKIREYGK